MTIFARPLKWLYKGLNLVEPKVPTDLETQSVQSVLDISQQGYGLADVAELVTHNVAASTAAADTDVIICTEDEQALILAVTYNHDGGAADLSADFWLRRTGATTATGLRIIRHTAAFGGSRKTWQEVSGNDRQPIWIPPGWKFTITNSATGVGETLRFDMLVVRAPAGYKLPF